MGTEELEPEGVDALREALAPVLDDVVATTDIGFVVDPRPVVQSCDAWSCVILPPGRTWEDVTNRPEHADALFVPGTWESLDVRMLDPLPAVIVGVADTVQSYVLPQVWAKTGTGVWPACPVHPAHPLWPKLDDGVAVWACARGTFRVAIGDLGRR